MVALVRHQSEPLLAPRPRGGHLRLVPAVDGPPPPRSAAAGGAVLPRLSIPAVVATAVVVFSLFGLIRGVQGAPGAASNSAGAAPVPAAAGPGDAVVVAGAGDSLWSIATDIAPGEDPRPVVAALIEANGGTSVQIGQQIVIPGHLLD